MKMLSRDFNAKVGTENIFKPTIGQESLRQDSNDNGDRLLNFATSKKPVAKSTMNFIQHPALKVKSICEGNYRDHQCGFRHNRSTTDYIFFIR